MKKVKNIIKIKMILIIVIISFIGIGNTFANDYKLNSSDKITINKLSSKIQNLLKKQNFTFRTNLESKINELQNNFKNNPKMFNIFEEIKKNNYLINYKEKYIDEYNSFNINFEKIENTWLNWHNEAREKLFKSVYSIDERLNNTAYEWSITQKEKGLMTHKRNSSDGFYNYPKIEKWFNERGIQCKVAGGSTTSESIGKFGYYCNDEDCTDELLKSLKEIFDIYMEEKGMKYPANAHYQGIVSSEFSKIGLGISINERFDDVYSNYRSFDYYVTTHYCTEFKN